MFSEGCGGTCLRAREKVAFSRHWCNNLHATKIGSGWIALLFSMNSIFFSCFRLLGFTVLCISFSLRAHVHPLGQYWVEVHHGPYCFQSSTSLRRQCMCPSCQVPKNATHFSISPWPPHDPFTTVGPPQFVAMQCRMISKLMQHSAQGVH